MICVAVAGVAANKRFTLVIDAGHGGHDAGAVGKITKEKIINLNVALAFGKLVEQNCPDVKVVYTRKTDVFIPLHTRADIANKNKADLFISIHTNALPKGHISRGLETYTLGMHRAADNLAVAKRENEVILYEKDYKQRYQGFDPNSSESYIMFEFMQDHNMAQSVELAKFVQRRTCAAANRQNKGVKQAGFLVLRETSMPSCLIELGFISTPDEERYLDSSTGVSQLGYGIYQAFVDYKRKYDTNVGVPYKVEPQPKEEVQIPTVVPEPVKQEVKQEDKKESKKEKKRKKKEEEKAVEEIEKMRDKQHSWWSDLKRVSGIGEGLISSSRYISEMGKEPDVLTTESVFKAETEILEDIARVESCVIAGRSGFFVFRNHPNHLRIMIQASMPFRVKRLMRKKNITEKEALKIIEMVDKMRENYVKRYTGTTRYDTRNYDLVITADGKTEDQIVDQILLFIEQ